MLIEFIHNNFKEKDYFTVRLSPEDKKNRQIYIEYMPREDTVYVVALVDYHEGGEWERLEYDNLTRSIKSYFYDKGFAKVNYLHVIATSRFDKVNELRLYMDPYWVVDDENLKWMKEGEATDDCYNAGEIVEASLQGKSFKKERTLPIPTITILLIAVNVLVFFLMEVFGSTLDTEFMLRYGAMNVERITVNREYYRFLTSLFLHFGIDHIANNMVVLGTFGYYMEGVLGKFRFLILYLVTGLVAGLVSFGYNLYMERYVVAAGASGAIFGLIGGLLFLVLKNRGKIQGMSIRRMVLFIFLSLYSGFTSQGVDNMAHIGGFLCGLIMMIGMPVRQRVEVKDED